MKLRLLAVLLTILLAAAQALPAYDPAPVAAGRNGAVAADHPLASEVGVAILKAGGNALDAAVASALAVGVLHPDGSGVGGGGFLVYWSAAEKRAFALDFRETAPAALARQLFYRNGAPSTELSQRGGLATGVPGEVAGLVEASRRFGKLPWRRLVSPAIALAERGFAVDEHLHRSMVEVFPESGKFQELTRIYGRGERALPRGARLRSPELSRTLQQIAADEGRSFYRGALARSIVLSVLAAGGVMTLEDLAAYRPVWREPVHGRYRGLDVYSMPPPSSGGAIVVQMLKALGQLPVDWSRPLAPMTLHYLAEVEKHGFADRATHFGDPAFVHVPVRTLTSDEHAARIARAVRPARTSPAEDYVHQLPEDAGTTHVSAMDAEGNACALTSSINTSFGSLLVVPRLGIVMNNHMDDFSLAPGVANAFGLVGSEKNVPESGKRPLSSMSPTLAVRDGRPVLAAGASGGPRIITGTLTVITNVVDAGMDIGAAVSSPRVHHQWRPDQLRLEETLDEETRRQLRLFGHDVLPGKRLSSVQAVVAGPSGFRAASDPVKGGRAAAW